MRYLEGDAVSCDETVELLVVKHPEIKNVQIGNEYIDDINITDRGLQTLLSAVDLIKVSLSRARLITGETLQLHSSSAQNIQHLALIFCSLTDKGLLKILQICGIQLTSLDVTGSEITGEGFDVLQDKFTNMETLSLCLCSSLTDQGLLKVLRMAGNNLQDLNISRTNITSQGLDVLQGQFTNLKTLNLCGCRSLTDQGLLKVLRMAGNNLQDLNISGTSITGQGLVVLQGQFTNLKILNLYNCNSLTDQGFCEIINISGPLLKFVYLMNSKISIEAKNRMKLTRPNLAIY